MTDLFLTDKLQKLLPKIKDFLHQEILPLEKDFLTKGWNYTAQKLEALRPTLKAEGLWGLQLPESLGGQGLSLAEFGQVSEILAYTPLGHYAFNCQAPDIGNYELLHQFGSKNQQEKYMMPLIAGKIRSCFSMTEPELAGSNPIWLATTAEKNGDKYQINGHKWFTSSYDGASFAIVMAVTNPQAPPHQRASMIIVPTETAGFEFVRNIPIMGDVGEGFMSHAEVRYQSCEVPTENLIGKEGEGFALAQHRLGPGRIHHCMRWIGISERAFEMMCRYALSRELNPNEPLAEKQVIQHWIADSRAEINAARLMVLDTARQIDAKGAAAVRNEISTIKFFVANIMLKIVDRAIQVHGALGITEDTILSFFYRHERGARIYDGADEVHKSALAKRILKGFKTEQPQLQNV